MMQAYRTEGNYLSLIHISLNSSSSFAMRSGAQPGKVMLYFSVKDMMYSAIAL